MNEGIEALGKMLARNQREFYNTNKTAQKLTRKYFISVHCKKEKKCIYTEKWF